MTKSMAHRFLLSCLVPIGSWLLAMGKRCAERALSTSRRILTRIFLREDDPAWFLPMKRATPSIRYLKHLGRLRWREDTLASDLGSLANAVRRQGLQEHARRFARGAFDHWRRARKAELRLRRKADAALGEQGL